ncbi:acyl-CoA dehydrogenase family protein [Umezawaea tangerina]|uniref:Alkylation response protein AidB-like acyl-CoA dehydrogenase n=1 Tax=Umezawaea tangerina TaxID=84725 RepID=A0A2T0SXI3_9PSEU|nr:acyl-CoA dehydrogenase [Umezawaea tangerina]PRY38131.1 alkylation response protein AidB-like acyl-CoA dehydrogenase [Umezawaea tangerina]
MTGLLSTGVERGADALDGPLRRLHAQCREVAPSFREVGVALDRDPDSIRDFLHLPAFGVLGQVFTPPEYQTGDLVVDAFDPTCTALCVVLEALSHGDPGAILAGPGAGLCRDVVRELGDDAQREQFFGRVDDGPTWTFFGLTEPGKGSAALELDTRLTPAPDGDGWLLHGEKKYIGNGARAQIGVVFCRRAPGPWGIEAVVVDPSAEGFSGELLPMVGLRGARISHLRFDAVRVPADRVLGRHRTPSRRGIYGALHALLRFRPGLGAMTLGLTQAACDYLAEHRPVLPKADQARVDALLDRIAAVRRMMYDVAADVDRGVVNAHRIGTVKMRAAQLGERATLLAAELLGPASLIEHPWLEKAYRDLRAFEFMEGTSNLHRLSVFQGLLKSDYFPAAGHADAPRH